MMNTLENKKTDNSVIASYSFPVLDGVGNRMQTVVNEPLAPVLNPGNTGYIYNDPKKNRLLSAGSDSFTYDDEGQLATSNNSVIVSLSNYTFDYEHRMTAISSQQSALSFSYNGKGDRLKAVRNGVTTYYVYDMNGNVLAEADGSKAITKYYVHGQGLIGMVTADNSVYNYHFNAIGSTIAITDASQVVVNKYSYKPFGEIMAQEELIPQPFKYVGQYGVMAESCTLNADCFYYMRARYYDPKVGRFVSEDPIDFKGGTVNLYEYVLNSPVNRIDPLGLEANCNGCGPNDWRSPFVPNRPFFIIDFTSACNTHDRCYAKCGVKKATCDTNFKGDTGLLCYHKYGSNIDPKYPYPPHPMLRPCYLLAEAYYKAVSEHGDSAYREAQKHCCKEKR